MISQGRAAEIAGLSRAAFLDELATRKIDVFHVDLNELKIMAGILKEAHHLSVIDKILRVVGDIRKAGIELSTRSIVQWALMLKQGFTHAQVYMYNLKYKYTDGADQIKSALQVHELVRAREIK